MTSINESRRNFLNMSGLGVAGLMGSQWSGAAVAAGSLSPDLIVFNAKVYTVDDSQPTAQAFAIKNDRFIAVGSNDEIKGYAGPDTKRFDAAGATIVPGFIDSHIHASGGRLLYGVPVGHPYDVEFVTIEDIIEKLRKKASELPPGTWIQGTFFDDTKVKDGRKLTRQDLDKASTQHPIHVRHRGGHIGWYNSKAFELAGVTRDTPNPPGGEFDHGPDGDLTGMVAERAHRAFADVGLHETFTPEQERDRARRAAAFTSKELVRYGLTSVQTNTSHFNELLALQDIFADGELLYRVNYEVGGQILEAMIANGIRSGFGNEWLKLGATTEYVVDGSFSGRTMAISTGYPGTNPTYYGIVTEKQDVINAWVDRVHRAGIIPNIHANGDVGIANTLTAYELAYKANPVANWRPKITHCTMINDDILRRMKAINACPAAFTAYTYYNTDKFHYYGRDIMNHCMAFRSFIDAGIVSSSGSDWEAGPLAPLMGIQGMVTRKGWNGEVWGEKQRVTVAEAIRISTLNGAYTSYEEDIKGSISPGKLADYVVLDKDPHTVDPETIMGIKILRTVTGGRTVYEA